jgi:hypothetical protein
MSDETTTRGTDGPPPARSGDAEIGRHLTGIVQKMVQEHMNWMTGFNNWANQMLMNMQPIPPQAYADMANRQRWLDDFLAQFDPIAAILKSNGHGDFAAELAQYQEGFDRLSTTRRETSAAMMEEDAATQRELINIQNKIAADNLKAAATRHKLQKDTAAFVQERTAEGIAAQQESNRRMNDSVRRGLFGL